MDVDIPEVAISYSRPCRSLDFSAWLPLNQAKQIFPHALARFLEGHGDLLGLVAL
jgi:hypothetical protein